MKYFTLLQPMIVGLSRASSEFMQQYPLLWAPQGPGDFRGPCPMMNTLANHGLLPHDGKGLTKAVVVGALKHGLNFDEALGGVMFDQALVANPEPNATYFTLDHLNRHNVLEHDASMSRSDAFLGNNHIFNQSIFDETRAYWTDEILNPTMLTNGKLFRQIQSRATNPNYTFASRTEAFSLGEVSAPIIVFGDMNTGTVKRSFVEYFFENERFPSELGWSKKADPISLDQIGKMAKLVSDAANLLTDGSKPDSGASRRRDLHAGVW